MVAEKKNKKKSFAIKKGSLLSKIKNAVSNAIIPPTSEINKEFRNIGEINFLLAATK